MLTEFHGLGAASEPYSGGAERDGRWLLKAIEDHRPENGDQDRRDAARDEAGHCCPLLIAIPPQNTANRRNGGVPNLMLGSATVVRIC